MNLVPLGQMVVSAKVRALLDAKAFDATQILWHHERGEGGALSTADEIFSHIGDVLRGRRVCSYWETPHGRLKVVTMDDRSKTIVVFVDELELKI